MTNNKTRKVVGGVLLALFFVDIAVCIIVLSKNILQPFVILPICIFSATILLFVSLILLLSKSITQTIDEQLDLAKKMGMDIKSKFPNAFDEEQTQPDEYCAYCGSKLTKSGKCSSCGATKKKS